MDTQRIKLILYWLFLMVVFYFFWAVSYFLTVKFLISQLRRFGNSTTSVWSELKLDDAFWYFICIAGVSFVLYGIHYILNKAPFRMFTCIVFLVLILSSTSLLVFNQSSPVEGAQRYLHLAYALVTCVPVAYVLFKELPENNSFRNTSL
ncbi:hypothetical protein [Pedobacter faecalis]|uniref:hypothetical protein n=1 Tax=Pedobacter faecalis TaxID=3041495 RepID=UPI00254A5E00|nr:hypothetical protein [Pedobacter sp. ELA7]